VQFSVGDGGPSRAVLIAHESGAISGSASIAATTRRPGNPPDRGARAPSDGAGSKPGEGVFA